MSIPRYTVSAMGRHVKEQRAVLRSRPGSPGSCLAHKESSKSPFLPAFLPLSSCSCTSSRPSLFRPSFRILPSRSSSRVSSSVERPFLAALSHANARTKRNCSRGPSGPQPACLPVPFIFLLFLLLSASSFIWPNLIHQRDPI